jgi:hypothetical protein
MAPESPLLNIAGERELLEWFGRVPRSHDAEIKEIALLSIGESRLRIRAWDMTDKVDSKGFFILEKRAAVTISLSGVTSINLNGFDLPGIIFELKISRIGDCFQVSWTGSYGVEGDIEAKGLSFALEPAQPDNRSQGLAGE